MVASLVAVGGVAVSIPASGSAAARRAGGLVDACGAGSYQTEPTSLVLTCADAGIIATRLAWRSWTSSDALATGAATVIDCTPSCAAGRTYDYPAELTLSRARLVDGLLLFTSATLRFTGRLPLGWHAGRTSTYPIPLVPKTADAQVLVTETWTAFFSANSSIGQKARLLENGTASVVEIQKMFAVLPSNLTTEVDSVRVDGRAATVRYRFFAGPHPVSVVRTGAAVDVRGRWLVGFATWAKLAVEYGVHTGG